MTAKNPPVSPSSGNPEVHNPRSNKCAPAVPSGGTSTYRVDKSPVPVNTKPQLAPLGRSQHLQSQEDGGRGGAQKGTEGKQCQMEEVRQDGKDREEAQKEALGQRPFIPGPSLPQTLTEQPALERCGTCDPCKTPDCGTCDSCLGDWPMAKMAQSRGDGAHTQEPCEAEQRRYLSWPEPPLHHYLHEGLPAEPVMQLLRP